MPLAGGFDVAEFNVATKEIFSSHGNGTMTLIKVMSVTSFAIEQNLTTMVGAKTLTLDRKTNRILTMVAEYGPVPAGRVAQGGRAPRGPMLPHSFSILAVSE